MRTPYSQRGISLLAWIAIVLVVGLFALFGAKTVPAYFNYYTLVNVAKSVQNERNLDRSNLQEVRQMINKRMRMNNIENASEQGYEVIAIKPARGDFVLEIDYEVRNQFIGNIDVVVSFHRSIEP